MASSDDEEELVPQSVVNYHFLDADDAPVSFSVLPILFDDGERPEACKQQAFLHGTGDDVPQKVFKEVVAWRLGLEGDQPEVTVLTKDKRWIKLLKPRKIYEDTVRTAMVTVQTLHFLRRNPESSEKSLWDHLRKVFCTFDERPSPNDLIDHYPLINLVVDTDAALAKSQLLMVLLKEQPRGKAFGEDPQNGSDSKKSFIVDDSEEDVENDDGDESEEEPDLFDSVCAICDNGGEIMCCEGICMRSFHATKKDGEDSDCRSLGFTRADVEAIQNFYCKNCIYKRHQCFACGELGSSDKAANPEVFLCVNATCGYFYHPKCVAELLFKDNKTEAAECEKKIASGESFACPVHKCHSCKQGENKEVEELQFAVCRRCPRSYHRKCLPRKISFEDIEEEGIVQRAWEEDLLPNRILIYCLKHRIDEDLGTPLRNHIKFPQIPERQKVMVKKRLHTAVPPQAKTSVKQISGDLPQAKTSVKSLAVDRVSSLAESKSPTTSGRSNSQQAVNFQKQSKPSKGSVPSLLKSHDSADIKESPKEKADAALPTSSSAGKVVISAFPKIDDETKKRMLAIMHEASSSVTMADVLKKRTVPSTHTHTAKNIDKSITFGKVEGAVEAVKTALQKLELGGSVEDAKAVCEPDVIKQLMRWNSKLRVYLAPFLHGMRYSSFGRHFTKVEKLKEIVDKLQWYVQSGDTIVDFCCGSNDFSRLMKQKLDAAGKECSFRNFDVIQPKYDFNFEKRDWMTVQSKDLPSGSKMIMGLNPPFGVKAGLANKFIDKALSFRPKLLILIVPKETERLDRKRSPYDLIWEDCEKLAGKSFYLPGSVDINDAQMDQWNLKPPPLYLWSRPDWTPKHKAIAIKQGHIGQACEQLPTEEQSQDHRSHPPDERIFERHDNKESMAKESPSPRIGTKEKSPERKRTGAENHGKGTSKNEKRRLEREMQEAARTGSEAKRKVQEAAVRMNEDATSDMSISPDAGERYRGIPLAQTPVTSYQVATEGPSNQESRLDFEGRPEGLRASPFIEENIGDVARRYTTHSDRGPHFSGNSRSWGAVQNLEERYSGYNNMDAFSRNPYADSSMSQPKPYGLQREDDYYMQMNRFSPGFPDPALGHGSALGQGGMLPPSSYGHSSLPGGSVMQRYAPQLDAPSYPRAPEIPVPGEPIVGGGRSNPYDMIPGVRRDGPPDSFGFPSGHQRGSAGGWIDD